MPYLFETPTIDEGPAGGARLFEFYTLPRGITVVKVGSKFLNVRYPTQDYLKSVDEYWIGGGTHTVSDATAAELIAAGYSDYLTEIV